MSQLSAEQSLPRVAVLILNYNGWRFLPTCLTALAATEYPRELLDVVVIDNASHDDSVAQVRAQFPWVRVLALSRNLGFAGGNNAGIRATDAPYVVLLNNDTAVEPGWLMPLVAAAQADPAVGACGAKLVYFFETLPVTLTVASAFRPADALPGSDDGRVLGVRLAEAALSAAHDASGAAVSYATGWYDQERAGDLSYRWSAERATLELPIADRGAPLELTLRFAGGPPAPLPPARVEIAIGASVLKTVAIGAEPLAVSLTIPPALLAHAERLIQNAGQELLPGGYTRDRGSFNQNGVEQHVRDGVYERQEEVFGLCGAAVLLRRRMLDQIGLLDDRFFMYYEDIDLCWRARSAGWRMVYVPAAVVRHVHSGSSGAWSPFFRFHVERNRLLMLIKNAPSGLARRAVTDYLSDTLAWTGRSLRALRHGLRPARANLAFVRNNLRVLASLLAALPYALRDRRTIRRRATVDDAAILAWTVR
jgi:hypothetical protein